MNQKKLLGIISVFAWVISISVIVFNNAFQLTEILQKNKDLVLSFIFFVISYSIYGIKNKKQLSL